MTKTQSNVMVWVNYISRKFINNTLLNEYINVHKTSNVHIKRVHIDKHILHNIKIRVQDTIP